MQSVVSPRWPFDGSAVSKREAHAAAKARIQAAIDQAAADELKNAAVAEEAATDVGPAKFIPQDGPYDRPFFIAVAVAFIALTVWACLGPR